jgi:hypothetical protein
MAYILQMLAGYFNTWVTAEMKETLRSVFSLKLEVHDYNKS